MIAIKVKYIPRTDKTGPRYKATCDLGTMIAPVDPDWSESDQELRVAKALAEHIGCKLGPGGGEYKGERYWGAVPLCIVPYAVYSYRGLKDLEPVKCVEGYFLTEESAIAHTKETLIGFQIYVHKLTVENNRGVEVYSCDRFGGLEPSEWAKNNDRVRELEIFKLLELSDTALKFSQSALALAKQLELEAGGYAP